MTASRPESGAAESPGVRVSDDVVAWREGLDLEAVVSARGVDPKAIATAVNGMFVARGERAALRLRPGDQVVLVAAIVGG